jgi:hypothetical protein
MKVNIKELDDFLDSLTQEQLEVFLLRAENIINNATKRQAPDFYQTSKSDQIEFLSQC